MNTILGIGIPELLVILILVIIVIGPARAQEFSQKAGRALGKLLRSHWWSDFQTIQRSIKDLPATLVRMAEIEDLQQDLEQSLNSIKTEMKTEAQDLSQELHQINNQILKTRTILPPQNKKNKENHG